MVICLSEIIKDALKLQTLQPMQQRGLNKEVVERWKLALMDLDAALDRITTDGGVAPAVRQSGREFDLLVDSILNRVLNADPLTPRAGTLGLHDSEQKV